MWAQTGAVQAQTRKVTFEQCEIEVPIEWRAQKGSAKGEGEVEAVRFEPPSNDAKTIVIGMSAGATEMQTPRSGLTILRKEIRRRQIWAPFGRASYWKHLAVLAGEKGEKAACVAAISTADAANGLSIARTLKIYAPPPPKGEPDAKLARAQERPKSPGGLASGAPKSNKGSPSVGGSRPPRAPAAAAAVRPGLVGTPARTKESSGVSGAKAGELVNDTSARAKDKADGGPPN